MTVPLMYETVMVPGPFAVTARIYGWFPDTEGFPNPPRAFAGTKTVVVCDAAAAEVITRIIADNAILRPVFMGTTSST
jgi:hypothetical protein